MTRHTALVVDDEPDICELLTMTLERMDIITHTANDIGHAKQLLSNGSYELCLTDMRLPDGNGIELVKHIQASHPELPVAVITAHGNMESAIVALKAGAFDFVSKPVDLQVLRNLVLTALRLSEKFPERDRRTRDILIGDSSLMQELRGTIGKLARSQAPVYISGESGTGKELVARMLHDKGPRSEQAFVPVNCGAIPSELMESEFFGHKKGSFTGATSDKNGLFQAAHGGTLFLDEVADLPLNMQVKLLRVIQERAVRPVGSAQEMPVDVRILCATHKPLADLVSAGTFRQDLFYRLNVIEVKVPPLRKRAEDLATLVPHIIKKLSPPNSPVAKINEHALAKLATYDFPGNIRELENILERAITLCEDRLIKAEDLDIGSYTQESTSAKKPLPDAQESTGDLLRGENLESYLENIERSTIMRALEETGNNKTAAARMLGITFRALRYRLKKLGLD